MGISDHLLQQGCGEQRFQTTHWTEVLQAGCADSEMAREAFANLYSQYWAPLYGYARKHGYAPTESEDIVQEFFVALMEKEGLQGLAREGGKFRSFLLKSLSHFLCNAWKKNRTQKRGGGANLIPLDSVNGESHFGVHSVYTNNPLSLFERQWALALLDCANGRLKNYYEVRGKAALFREIGPYLQKDPSRATYAEAALRIGVSEGAVKVAVHRLRNLFGQLLREEVSRTVGSPDEVDGEIKYLIGVLCG